MSFFIVDVFRISALDVLMSDTQICTFKVTRLRLDCRDSDKFGPRQIYELLSRMHKLPYDARDEDLVRTVKNWICCGKKYT